MLLSTANTALLQTEHYAQTDRPTLGYPSNTPCTMLPELPLPFWHMSMHDCVGRFATVVAPVRQILLLGSWVRAPEPPYGKAVNY